MSNYFESYSFEVPSTDPKVKKQKYTFSGDQEYIRKLKSKPVEIQNTQNVNGWLVTFKGYDNGTLKITAEKMIDTRTIKIESIQSNRLSKFKVIQMEEDYSPYDPVGDTNANYIEINDKQNKTNVDFTQIDSKSEDPYQKCFSNSSILSIAEFLHDEQFNKMLKSVKFEAE
jgi:hypothetical protein